MTATDNTSKVFNVRDIGKVDINFSSKFLLPSIYLSPDKLMAIKSGNFKKGFQVLNYYGFKNVYLWDENVKTNKHSLLLLFNPTIDKLHKWYEFKNVYSKFTNYIGEYIIDSGLIVLEFLIIKPEFYPLKTYLIKGEYSKMNIGNYINNFKKVVDSNQLYMTEEGLIITKSNKFKEELEEKLKVTLEPNAELGSIPDLEKEILNLNYTNL